MHGVVVSASDLRSNFFLGKIGGLLARSLVCFYIVLALYNNECHFVFFLYTRVYIEEITRRREDKNFILEWQKQYFTKERSE